MTTLEDQPWLDRACAGDRDAFGQLIRLHHRRVVALALRLVGDRATADDVAQETFLNAFRAITDFDRKSQLSSWLYRICVNVALATRKRRGRYTSDGADSGAPVAVVVPTEPTQAIAHARAMQQLARGIDALPEVYRVTLILAYTEDISYKDIGLILGCKEGTVAWRIHEARRLLRASLDDTVIHALDDLGGQGGHHG